MLAEKIGGFVPPAETELAEGRMMMLQLKEGAGVYTPGGDKVGEIDRVVMDPKTREVTHVVAKKGLLFTHEKVLPLTVVDTSGEEKVVLKQNAPPPEEYPDFEEKTHIPISRDKQLGYALPMAYYPAVPATAWWGTYGYPGYPPSPYVVKIERNIPKDTIPLEEGAEVITRDGEQIGKIERIHVEPNELRATHITVSQGLLSKERKLIPTLWVGDVFEDHIRLAADKEMIERLPASSD
jgi:uncharacterized protein YrrD